jgi:hypothetical protein
MGVIAEAGDIAFGKFLGDVGKQVAGQEVVSLGAYGALKALGVDDGDAGRQREG